VRTRLFLKDMSNWQQAGRAHGEFFKDIRPASTMIQIVQAIDPAGWWRSKPTPSCRDLCRVE
jgi:hypothetical protein